MKVKKAKRGKIDPNRNNDVDRITDLPEWIIHDQIMSRLSRRDRARSRILSKTWYRLNKTYPVLDLDFDALWKENSAYSYVSSEFRKIIKSFRKRADQSLSRFRQRNLCLNSLRVRFSYSYPRYKSDLIRWVESALDNKVKKLKLYGPFTSGNEPEDTLPRSVYFSATLTTLKLVNCLLDQPLSAFRSLKKLTLSECKLNDGPLVLKRSDCPALESLALYECYGFDSIHISDLVQLHTVIVQLFDSKDVEIASRSLQKLSIQIYRFDNVNPWMGSCIYGCSGLKFLHFYSDAITDQQFHDLLSKLPLLEDLYITGCHQLEAMLVSSPRLKTLLICPSTDSRLKSIDIKVTTIKNFIFSSSMRQDPEIKVPADCCLETLVLSGIDLRCPKLIAKFPLLQSLWISSRCTSETLEIPNLQLKRLHIARCFRLKAVKVASRELEMYCRDREDLEISVPNPERTNAYETMRCNQMPNRNGDKVSVCLQKMLALLVKDKYVAEIICDICS